MMSIDAPAEQLPSGYTISSQGRPPTVLQSMIAVTSQATVLGKLDGVLEGSSDGTGDGGLEGSFDGLDEGGLDGWDEGELDGCCDGAFEGALDGCGEGRLEGGLDGCAEGGCDGLWVGLGEGGFVGPRVGLGEGGSVGLCVGRFVTLLISFGKNRCQKSASSSKTSCTFSSGLSLREALSSAFSKARAVRRRNVFVPSSA
jgi:hypothetical protein